MKRAELKKLIKPMVRECVQETLLKEGLLSNIVAEVAQGLGNQEVIREIKEERPRLASPDNSSRLEEIKRERKQLLDAIGKDAYNGVDLFEGTNPIRDSGNPSPTAQASPMHGQEPDDPGVDISGILSVGGKNWKALLG
tara:strand:- start:405 stop:821 length:417 start_codon:yes stop_codon:yes gene_type:complete